MAIKFSCPNCKRPLNVKDDLAGKRGPCPGCKKIITIPARSSDPAATGSCANPAPRLTFEELERAAASAFLESSAPAPKPEQTRTIDFPCPHCDTVVTVAADLEGKQTPCSNPECRRIIRVPVRKKQQPLDWRKTDKDGLPSLAKREAEPVPEGAWGNVTASAQVSEEALEEAGVIQEETEPTPVGTWIRRGVILTFLVVIAVGGTWWGLSAWSHSKQTNLYDLALKGVSDEPDKPKLGASQDAVIYIASSEYLLRGGTADGASKAMVHLRQARSFVRTTADVNRDYLLIEIGLRQVDLGPDAAGKAKRLTWDDVQHELQTTIQQLGHANDSSDPYGPRAEALRLICRKLIENGQTQIAYSLAVLVGSEKARAGKGQAASGELPEALGVAGLEFLRAKQTALAEQLALKVLPASKGSGRPVPPPAPSAIALCLATDKLNADDLKEPPPDRKDYVLAGLAIDAARRGTLDKAKELAEKVRVTAIRLNALTALADAGQPDPALELAARDVRGIDSSPWQYIRLARLAASTHGAQVQAAATGDDAVAAWMQFQVVAAKLHDAAPDRSLAESIPADTAAQGLACLMVARQATAKGKNMQEQVDGWPANLKPFGYMGIALGMQDRERK